MIGQRTRLVAVLVGIGVIPAAFAQTVPVAIRSATPNTGAHVLAIEGGGFGASTPVVTLGTALLTVIASSNTLIDAILPDVVPGSYHLVVARVERGRIAAFDSIDVTIGVVGATGPTGPAGDAGSPGPPGTPGQSGGAGPGGPVGTSGPSLPFGTITGRARTCGGTPAARAHAFIAGSSFDAMTADDGRFALLYVPPGTFVVSVETSGETATQAGVVVADHALVDIGDVTVCTGGGDH